MAEPSEAVIALSTLQFAWGGLLDSTPADNLGHLVRRTRLGTPGPTLCGIERFAEDAPGFSVGGGVVPHGVTAFEPCAGCVQVAKDEFPGLPVAGLKELGKPLAEAIGTVYGRYHDDAVKAVTDRG